MKPLVVLLAAAAAAVSLAAPASAVRAHHQEPAHMPLPQRLHYQQQIAEHDRTTIRWWTRHQNLWPRERRLLVITHGHEPYDLWWHRQQLRWVTREIAETRHLIASNAFPAHHALWMCIHHYEAGSWQNADTGGNGHYGGLQMHPGWGYGTSYLASDDTQRVQEHAAETAYRASGWSRSWLNGQWGETVGNCWQYA